MTPEQFIELKDLIKSEIKITVNGKIDRLQDSVEKTDVKLENHIVRFNEFKDEIKPYIENIHQLSGFANVGSTLLKTIITLGGAVTVIWAAIKYLKY